MTTLTQPRLGVPIGTATIQGRPVEITIHPEWARFFSDLFSRVGGVSGAGSDDLVLSQFEDAGIEELKAAFSSLRDEVRQIPLPPEAPEATTAVGGNSVAVTCDFGASFTDKAQTVVTGQTWVTASSEITAQVLTPSGTDPDEIRLLDLRPVISDLVAGTGFTVTLYSEPEAKGSYTVMCIGV